ncbi:MAG: DUF3089 domain-containing protein [Acidobacteria bacterium]|nr:DUF3089 domain-containing protein [Acidobacteriota bacterium]
MPSTIICVLVILGSLACAAPGQAQTPQPGKNDYRDVKNWLCRPNGQDACAIDLTTTIVAGDGKLTREAWKGNTNAPVDCFYVYPTVSRDTTPNSDMSAGPEERMIVASQLARFASQCRVYAPMYRQITLAGLRSGLLTRPGGTPERAMAYNDVRDAWNYYLEHDNRGRGFVLIGHSQGSFMLTDLIRDEIDGKASQSRLVSAMLLGTNLPVPKGKDVGGALQHVPLCHAASETGCVITYASFRSSVPPPEGTLFGRVSGEGMMAACTNPAALHGGSAPIHAYLKTAGNPFTLAATPIAWVTPPASIDTPFVSVPGLLTAQCVSNEHGSYLEVTVHGNPADPRADDIVGDVMTNGQPTPSWGLHLIDVNLTIGNLVDLVRDQTKSHLTKKGR